MSSRRPHQKPHHGCTTCKRRKIKCDEMRPDCSPCSKRHSRCSFREDYFPMSIPSSNAFDHQHRSVDPQAPTDFPLPVLELQLLHHGTPLRPMNCLPTRK
ncbi:hypothetical protein DL95DRAFT_317658 [Leptodontidium sp. 2 PMI_412]|nr:hypothetical protein DL95DRAFT_317658 [Leptodontidium sp. 2 PMI_412]